MTILCLAISVLGANPFAHETVAPMDLLMKFPGWGGHPGPAEMGRQHGDILNGQFPVWITLKKQIRSGQSALWYPHGAGGEPVSLELCNPTFWLFVAIKDHALAYYLVGLAKLVSAGFGAYLLLSMFTGWVPSIWGGLVFMVCGFNSAWFFWEQVAVSMWIPWLFWAILHYLRSASSTWLPAVTAVSLLMIFGGYPAVAAFGFYSSALFLVIWNAAELRSAAPLPPAERWGLFAARTGFPLSAIGVAFIMAAVALLPFWDSLSGINLGYRIGETWFDGARDLLLFFTVDKKVNIERTAFIGVIAVLFAIIGAASALHTDKVRLKWFISLMAALTVLATLIAFGLLPHGLIRAVPVFNFNRWDRLIVISHLGLAVLSAAGVDFALATLPALLTRYANISERLASGVVMLAVVSSGALQFHEQKKFFNLHNPVVPAAWFYPVTPSLAFIQGHTKPLQSVIADFSYLPAGTLGAYGIAEWYAHGFRTDKEKAVLRALVREPFQTATTGYFTGSDIHMDSPLMDAMAIKYVLVNKYREEKKRLISMIERSPSLSPSLTAAPLRQQVELHSDAMISSFGVRWSTFGAPSAPGSVRLTLYDAQGNKYPFEPEIGANDIADGQWASFEFPYRLPITRGRYTLELSLVGHAGVGKLAAWTTRGYENTGNYLEQDGKPSPATLNLRIVEYQAIDPGMFGQQWRAIDLEKEVLLLENTRVTNGAYFVRDRSEAREQPDFSGLAVMRPSAGLIDINSMHQGRGWIVLPMHLDPGWKAYVNGERRSYDTYIDILPAIPVTGPCRVLFQYEPESFRLGAEISIAGMAIFIIFSIICWKNGKRIL